MLTDGSSFSNGGAELEAPIWSDDDGGRHIWPRRAVAARRSNSTRPAPKREQRRHHHYGLFPGIGLSATTLTANNAIGELEGFTTGNGDFTLTDTLGLQVTSALNVGTGNLTLTSGGAVNLYAPVAGATVDLVSAGAIGQNNSGTITTSTFTGSSAGSTILLAQNAITNLGSFSTNNNAFALINAQNLTIDGAVNLGTSYGEIYSGGTLVESGAAHLPPRPSLVLRRERQRSTERMRLSISAASRPRTARSR